MSSPAEWFHSLPAVSKIYGTICLATTVAYHIGLVNIGWIYLDYSLIARKFQIWRLLTTLIFLGPFSMHFGMRLLMIARYGVQLEKGPFEKRTADFLWMIITTSITALILALIIPPLNVLFLGSTICFMLVYVWSREFPTSKVSLMGLAQFQGFYLPWALLALNTMFGTPVLPDLLGIIIGHVYYFLAVLHPRNGGKDLLKTPKFIFKLLAKYRIGEPPRSSPVPPPQAANQGRVFSGRSYRLSRD